MPGLLLTNRFGQGIAHLSWSAADPGLKAIWALLPVMAVAALLFLAL